MISVDEALAIIAATLRPAATETVMLSDAAGRVLRQSVIAERDQPPFDRVTMDGAAIRWQPTARALQIVGTQFAGDPPQQLQQDDCAIEIMTGAAMPSGADTVVPVERYRVEDGDGAQRLLLEDGYAAVRGQFIHRRGSDHRIGSLLLKPGVPVGANEIAVIASAGLAQVTVNQLPRIAIVATGNELVAAGQSIEDHQVRLSNGPALAAALALAGYPGASLHHFGDDPAQLQRRLGALLEQHDVMILSGGVSRGKADHVPDTLARLGVVRHFHRIAQRPGKPMWFGSGPDGQLVFALPGNPVSTLTCFRRYVRTALDTAAGMPERPHEIVRLGADWQFAAPLTAFVPVHVQSDATGVCTAMPVTTNTSGDFTALAGTDGFIELPAERSEFNAGDGFRLFRW